MKAATDLRSFLRQNYRGRDEPAAVDEALALLEPFYLIAESKKYDLLPDEEIDPVEAMTAIRKAVGRVQFTKIISVSAASQPSKPEWDRMRVREDGIGDTVWTDLYDGYHRDLGSGLWYGLRAILGDGSVFPYARDNVFECITWFLYFTVADRPKDAERLKPLMRLLPRAIPLGNKHNRRRTWFVLVA